MFVRERGQAIALAQSDGVTLPASVFPADEIEPQLLRSNSFDEFLRDRASRLLNLIEAATGKSVAGRDSEETTQAFAGSLNP